MDKYLLKYNCGIEYLQDEIMGGIFRYLFYLYFVIEGFNPKFKDYN